MEGEHPAAFLSLLLGGLGRSGDDAFRKSGQVLLLVENEGEAVVLGQDVLAELLVQNGQLLVDLAELGFFRLVQGGSAADEMLVGQIKQPGLLGAEAESLFLLIDGFNPLEQLRVEGDVVGVFGEKGGQLGLDFLKLGVGVVVGQGEKDVGDFLKQRPAVFQGFDRVGEGRRLDRGGEGGDLVFLPGHRFPERGQEMGLLDQVERRGLKRRRPFNQEGVDLGGGRLRRAGEDGGDDHRGKNENEQEDLFHRIFSPFLGMAEGGVHRPSGGRRISKNSERTMAVAPQILWGPTAKKGTSRGPVSNVHVSRRRL